VLSRIAVCWQMASLPLSALRGPWLIVNRTDAPLQIDGFLPAAGGCLWLRIRLAPEARAPGEEVKDVPMAPTCSWSLPAAGQKRHSDWPDRVSGWGWSIEVPWNIRFRYSVDAGQRSPLKAVWLNSLCLDVGLLEWAVCRDDT